MSRRSARLRSAQPRFASLNVVRVKSTPEKFDLLRSARSKLTEFGLYDLYVLLKDPVCIAVLPDHLTPVEQRIHVGQPVPFLIWHRDIQPDDVQQYDEVACVSGSYGLLKLNEFMHALMRE